MPPEFWMLGNVVPVIPASLLFLYRLIYLPMSYLYGKRFVGPITPLILQLRQEIYTQPYNNIKWSRSRHYCAKVFANNQLLSQNETKDIRDLLTHFKEICTNISSIRFKILHTGHKFKTYRIIRVIKTPLFVTFLKRN